MASEPRAAAIQEIRDWLATQQIQDPPKGSHASRIAALLAAYDQVAAGRETWRAKALEMEADRNRLAAQVEFQDARWQYVEEHVLDGLVSDGYDSDESQQSILVRWAADAAAALAAIEQVRAYAEGEYVRALNAVLASPNDGTDAQRWRGHAEALRQVAERVCHETGAEVPDYRSDDWRRAHGLYSQEQVRQWTQPQSVYPVVTHGPDEPIPADLDWTAEDQHRWEWRMARGFPERDYTDPTAPGFPQSYHDQGSAGQADANRPGKDGHDATPSSAEPHLPADPSFRPVAATQFVSGYQATKSEIEADR